MISVLFALINSLIKYAVRWDKIKTAKSKLSTISAVKSRLRQTETSN
jgi:hypothetical protein